MARKLLLGFAAIAPLLSLALLHRSLAAALAPIFVSHLFLLYATLVANNQWWGPVFTRFETAANEVWLTIDDGPSPQHTLQILDLLDRFEARATFFVIGRNAEAHPHLVTEMLRRGHAIANHTDTHPSSRFWCAGAACISREIDEGTAMLRETKERPQHFFRAPAGLKSPFLHPALRARGLMLVGWTVRGLDTVLRDPVRIAERIERGTTSGAIIVLHDGHQVSRDPDFGVRCVEATLQVLSARGYAFVIPAPEQLRTSAGE